MEKKSFVAPALIGIAIAAAGWYFYLQLTPQEKTPAISYIIVFAIITCIAMVVIAPAANTIMLSKNKGTECGDSMRATKRETLEKLADLDAKLFELQAEYNRMKEDEHHV